MEDMTKYKFTFIYGKRHTYRRVGKNKKQNTVQHTVEIEASSRNEAFDIFERDYPNATIKDYT
jgi:hypothetical protein